jgi:SAM-dependent methyltransferase
MKPPLGDVLAYMRCPASGAPLVLSEDGSLTANGTGRRYPVVDGVPILIAGEKSLFDSASFELWGESSAPNGGVRGWLRRFAKWLLRLPPTASRNVGSLDNYDELQRLLHASMVPSAGPARVLVVGGGDAGVGSEAIVNDPGLTVVETDVYLGPRVGVVCDAHDLPFVDASFDAAICQAVLEHVIDPARVADEIRRVLRPDGLVYSEVPFMQQVHAGAFDFTRFTLVGHRLLWRHFDELRAGAQGGPGMALIWSIAYFLRAPLPRQLWPAADRMASLGFFWLKYLDGLLVRRPGGLDAASGTFFLGRRRASAIDDRELVRGYRGGGPRMTW